MAFTNFRANVLLRVAVLVALCLALVWSLLNTEWLATPTACAALLVLSVFELIRYVEKTSRDLTSFLSFIAHHDYSSPVSIPYKGRVFSELQHAYRTLTGEYRRLNLQRAADHQYLQAIIEHVGVALCCFDSDGLVEMMNEPARRLFEVPHLHSVRTFSRVDERLPQLLLQLADGERARLGLQRGDDTLQLVLYATTFELLGKRYKLVSFQNIRDELDRQEIDSWQKLIRVLTHEIMNSVTPIISLSRLIRETMIDDEQTPPTFRALQPQEQGDMLRSVTAIHARSSGLLDFVQAYRSFAKLPPPMPEDLEVEPLLERVRTLMSQEVDSGRILLRFECAEAGLRIRADASQIEQVLINLLRNSVEAVAESQNPRVEVRALQNDQGRVVVQVIDNGPGIAPEHLDNIFVPFFTTKRNGTGVGLSVSRQIMHANRGLISVRSTLGAGCVFTLIFPARAVVR
jgi:two-component system, NtrC family, nitrogen regulation sensor histidine kinase NtrY